MTTHQHFEGQSQKAVPPQLQHLDEARKSDETSRDVLKACARCYHANKGKRTMPASMSSSHSCGAQALQGSPNEHPHRRQIHRHQRTVPSFSRYSRLRRTSPTVEFAPKGTGRCVVVLAAAHTRESCPTSTLASAIPPATDA
jgi:hypothetical protein